MVGLDQAAGVGEDDVGILHGLLRRQPAVLLPQGHGAASEHGPHAEFSGHLDLDVDRVVHTCREQVVVVGGCGASGFEEFGHGHSGGQFEGLRRQPGPDRIEVRQPPEERQVRHGSPRSRQGLVEVMVGVDQTRSDHVRACIDHLGDGLRPTGGLTTCRDEFNDGSGLFVDDDAAGSLRRVDVAPEMDSHGIAQPQRGAGRVGRRCCGTGACEPSACGHSCRLSVLVSIESSDRLLCGDFTGGEAPPAQVYRRLLLRRPARAMTNKSRSGCIGKGSFRPRTDCAATTRHTLQVALICPRSMYRQDCTLACVADHEMSLPSPDDSPSILR